MYSFSQQIFARLSLYTRTRYNDITLQRSGGSLRGLHKLILGHKYDDGTRRHGGVSFSKNWVFALAGKLSCVRDTIFITELHPL